MVLGAAVFPLCTPVVVCMPPSKLQRTGLAEKPRLPGAAMASALWIELKFNHAASEAAAGLSVELPD